MGRIGETLREARESKNLTLRDAEEATKIRLKYLKDLENENFDALPGRAYVIGFLKTYARFLQIEDQALVEEYKATNRAEEHLQNQRNKSNSSKVLLNNRPSKLHSILVVFLAIVLLLGTNFIYNYLGSRKAPQQDETQVPGVVVEEPSSDEKAPTPTDEKDKPIVEEPVQSNKVQVAIRISDEEDSKCWVNVVADNKTIFTGTMTAGEEKSFEADNKLELKLGNAGVAYVVANGEDLGFLGARGAVVTKVFEKNNL